MKLMNSKINQETSAKLLELQAILTKEKVPVQLHRLIKIITWYDQQAKELTKTMEQVRSKYTNKDENGKEKTKMENGQEVYDINNKDEYVEEINKLFPVENESKDIKPVCVTDLTGINIPQEIMWPLLWLFEE